VPARGKTVLVVDDEGALRTLAAKVIEKQGYTVVTASEGIEALAILSGGTAVDLLVLDVVMPGLNGLQTLEEIRKRWSSTELPVVLLTAQSKDEQIIGGYKKGADYYLTKPLKPSALVNIIDYLIGDLSPEETAKIEPLL